MRYLTLSILMLFSLMLEIAYADTVADVSVSSLGGGEVAASKVPTREALKAKAKACIARQLLKKLSTEACREVVPMSTEAYEALVTTTRNELVNPKRESLDKGDKPDKRIRTANYNCDAIVIDDANGSIVTIKFGFGSDYDAWYAMAAEQFSVRGYVLAGAKNCSSGAG